MRTHRIFQTLLALIILLACIVRGEPVCAAQDSVQVSSPAESAITEVFNGEPSLIDSVFGLRLALLPLADVTVSVSPATWIPCWPASWARSLIAA
jgi:hypothetical protein